MTRCLILAAGEGRRLRPLTDDCPKGMVVLKNKPLLNHQIAVLNAAGITEIAIATGYKPKLINQLGYPTYHNVNYDKTNMVESLFNAVDFFEGKEDDLIIAYGDIVYEAGNLEALLGTEGDMVIMVDDNWASLWSGRNEDPLMDAETLMYDTDGFIRSLGDKPVSMEQIEGQYTGLIKVSSEKIKDLLSFYRSLDRSGFYSDSSFDQMYMTTFIQLLIDSGWRVRPAHVQSGWLEVDTVKDLEFYEELEGKGELARFWSAHG